MHLATIGRGVLLGLGAAAPIGPVNLEIARRSLRQGFAAGFSLGCGAATIDILYAVVSSLSVRPLLNRPGLLTGLGIVGGLFIGYLGVMCFVSAAKPIALGETSGRSRRNYLTGLLMTGLNPMTLAFWFIAVPGVVGQITADPKHDLPWVCAGVFAATIAWVGGFSGSCAGGAMERDIMAACGGCGRWNAAAGICGGGDLAGGVREG